ncbi:PTS transporter subunit IIC [Streptococcus porcinus]|uniref:PTS system, galactitol-specific IIC n=2 Tax=Streptococcus porcinus TaxID=1340 RepID=A0A4V0H230_STRPO|nr:PTS transporter subunit IIC [Streptococcus porcinus]EGJ27272.1 PTS system protein Galactitol-specific IIC component [Streptococcus porcinus str. Jelinkova 176]SQG42566.1 PTS system, galactitol-specific IIC [Streptococcus porcinus]VTT41603.1 PTS system, galactitol-specific IIC [Streptococcus porcinus]VTT42614.1 PTS system, galactitol-specific IIC [Streptococcus porcinus]
METLQAIMKTITSMGASAILPLVIFILGLVFRMKVTAAIKAGITVGIGFIGLGLVVELLSKSLQPAIDYYSKMGSGFTIMDLGWPAVGAAAWVAPFAGLVIPIGLVLNILLVRLKWTKTLNVDIWNYMHFLVPGALAYFIFDNFLLGLVVSVVLSLLALIVGDKIAPMWQEYYGLEDTTCTTLIHTAWTLPFVLLVNRIIDVIPGLNTWDISLEKLQKRLGLMGDPAIIGVIVGIILGVLTKQPITAIVPMAMGIAAVQVLLPKVVGILMEGLSPIGKAAKTIMMKQMGEDSELNIGMDCALALGDPATVTVTVITIPLTMLAALVLPGVRTFPIGILTSIIYMTTMTVMASKGNVIRSIISTLLFSIVVMYLGAYVAPGATEFLKGAGVKLSSQGTDFVLTGPWEILTYWIKTLVAG